MFIPPMNSAADFTRWGIKSFLLSHKQIPSQIPSPQRVKVNAIIKWLIKWRLCISDEHLLLTINITEEKRNIRTTTDFKHSLGWNQLKGKKNFATIIVVSICFSWTLEPFNSFDKFASKQMHYCFIANICAMLKQVLN